MTLTHVFFDIGGVLGTNAWDHEQRARAVEHFKLDDEFEARHQEVVGEFESGRLDLGAYLDTVIFFRPRDFSRDEMIAFMRSQSQPFPDSLRLARELKEASNRRLMTLNNESDELNRWRIESFGLRDVFSAFLSSCWLGMRKPSPVIFQRALAIAQAEAERVLFIDDRQQNLAPAAALGFQTLQFTSCGQLETALHDLKLL